MHWNIFAANPLAKPYGHEDDTLYVQKDWIGSNGQWRLVWSKPDDDSLMPDESSVTGRPYFRTMKEAVAYGEYKYGIRAKKADW